MSYVMNNKGLRLAGTVLIGGFSFWLAAANLAQQQPSWGDGGLEAATTAHCYTYELFEEPANPQKSGPAPAALGWTTSAVWHGDTLILADSSHERFVKTRLPVPAEGHQGIGLGSDDVGRVAGRVEAIWIHSKEAAAGVLRMPEFVAHNPRGGYVFTFSLRDEGAMSIRKQVHFAGNDLRLDRFLEPESRKFTDGARKQQMVSEGFFQAVPMDRGIFNIGGARELGAQDEPEWRALFSYIDHAEFIPYEVPSISDAALQDLAVKYFNLNLNLLAVVEEDGEQVAYILFLEEAPARPWIGRARRSSTTIERLKSFPIGWSVPPSEVPGPNDSMNKVVATVEARFRNIETHPMPVGLYAWRNRLMLLVKSGANPTNGRTAWHFIEISKETGEATGDPILLPAQSEHLLVAPAMPDNPNFAILERGAVDAIRNPTQDYLYRPGNSAVIFPETWLDTPGLAKSATCRSGQGDQRI